MTFRHILEVLLAIGNYLNGANVRITINTTGVHAKSVSFYL